MTKIIDLLSDDPVEALEQLVEDLKVTMAASYTKFNMHRWCVTRTQPKKLCTICLAGAIMHNRFGCDNGVPSDFYAEPDNSVKLFNKFMAFDDLRHSLANFLLAWPCKHNYDVCAIESLIQLPQLMGWHAKSSKRGYVYSKQEIQEFVDCLIGAIHELKTNPALRKQD